MLSKFMKSKNYIVCGSRAYGVPLVNIKSLFIRGIHSWSVNKLWDYFETTLKDKYKAVLSIKRITNFNDSFLLVKSIDTNNIPSDISDILKTRFPHSSIVISKISKLTHNLTFSSIKRNFTVSNKQQITTSSQQTSEPTSSNHSNNYSNRNTPNNTSISSNTSDNNSTNILYTDNTIGPNNTLNDSISNNIETNCNNNSTIEKNNNLSKSSRNKKPFSLCLSWNTNGWNYEKKDSIEYFITVHRPLFLCFQETGNGSGSNSQYPCRVKIRNYKHFFKKADNSIPGKRGLYLGIHNSCQASIEDDSFDYIISLYTFNLWNKTKCSIGNVYIPQKRHNLFVRHAKTEVLTWLRNHDSHPSILVGDFNTSKIKLAEWISSLGNWEILSLQGSSISWTRGTRSSDIDHAIVNKEMKKLLSSGFLADFYPISDHKPLLIKGKPFTEDDFTIPRKFLRWNRVKCIDEKNSICNDNRFQILATKIQDPNNSIDDLSKEFVDTAYLIAENHQITSYKEIIKASFHMSQSIFNLQRVKMKLYKTFRKKNSLQDLDKFLSNLEKYQKLCATIHKKCNEFRK